MVFEKVRDVLAEQLELNKDDINEDTDIVNDLGADSLDVVELIMSLEDEYGVVITDESVHSFHTVGDVVTFIENTLKTM